MKPKIGSEASHTWRLQDIYADWRAWEEDWVRLEELLAEFQALAHTLSDGPNELLRALELRDVLDGLAHRLFRYANLSREIDLQNEELGSYEARAHAIQAELAEASAWFAPALLAIGPERVWSWVDLDPKLSPYGPALRKIFRIRPLASDGQSILESVGRLLDTPSQIYHALSSSVTYEEITLENGERSVVSQANIRHIFEHNRSQDDRRRAFEAIYSNLDHQKHTYAAILNASCQANWFMAQARGYTSIAAWKLDEDELPIEVLDSLKHAARESSSYLQDYHRARKSELGLAHYYFFDTFCGLVEEQSTYSFEEAAELVQHALAPLGDEYGGHLEDAFSGHWFDVHPREGKSPWTYVASVPGTHPFILLNFHSTLNDVFSIAHEVGHAIHSQCAAANQPYVFSGWSLSVCELAPLVNEMLLLAHLRELAHTPQQSAALLHHGMLRAVGNFFVQAFYLDFEQEVHRRIEANSTLTAQDLRAIWDETQRGYFGDVLTPHPLYNLTWARLRSLYTLPFYNYPYALAWAAAAHVVGELRSPDLAIRSAMQRRYMEFLQSGGAKNPIEQLNALGVRTDPTSLLNSVTRQLKELQSP